MATPFDERPARLDRARNRRFKIYDLVLELDLPLADSTHVEEIIEEARHLMDLTLQHRVQRFMGRIASGRASQHLDDVPNWRQRIAQFMAEHREKLVLAAIGDPQKLLDAFS